MSHNLGAKLWGSTGARISPRATEGASVVLWQYAGGGSSPLQTWTSYRRYGEPVVVELVVGGVAVDVHFLLCLQPQVNTSTSKHRWQTKHMIMAGRRRHCRDFIKDFPTAGNPESRPLTMKRCKLRDIHGLEALDAC